MIIIIILLIYKHCSWLHNWEVIIRETESKTHSITLGRTEKAERESDGARGCKATDKGISTFPSLQPTANQALPLLLQELRSQVWNTNKWLFLCIHFNTAHC